jgi:arginase
MSAPWSMIGVPIDSVGQEGGTELAPAALRARGLAQDVGAVDRGDLMVAIRDGQRDPVTGVVGIEDVLAVTTAVRDAVSATARAGHRPLIIGGCCTLVPGALAGLRDAGGPLGLVYVDGHVDIYDGESSPTGEAADMPVSVALGLGPTRWVDAAGGPSVVAAHAPVLGARDEQEAHDIAGLLSGPLTDLIVSDPATLRARGLATAATEAANLLAHGPGRFFVHLDVDVLDQQAMPATDYLMAGGLSWEELAELLGPLGSSPALAGLSLGCLNPEKDPTGEHTARTAALLVQALTP